MRDTAALQAALEPVTAALGYEFLGCICVPQKREVIVRVYIDSPNGITLSDCERVSRQLSAVLDVEDLIPGHYTLEVSSPGLDRPLFTLTHFGQFVGAKTVIRLRVPMGTHKHFKGVILGVTATEVMLEVGGEELIVPLTNIVRANLLPNYENTLKRKKP